MEVRVSLTLSQGKREEAKVTWGGSPPTVAVPWLLQEGRHGSPTWEQARGICTCCGSLHVQPLLGVREVVLAQMPGPGEVGRTGLFLLASAHALGGSPSPGHFCLALHGSWDLPGLGGPVSLQMEAAFARSGLDLFPQVLAEASA